MPGQTVIPSSMAVAAAGMLEGPIESAITRVIATAAGVNTGRAVRRGSVAGRTCELFAADADSALIDGIVIRQPMRERSTPDFPQNTEVTLLRRGAIWLTCPVAIAPTDNATLSWLVTGGNAGLLTNVVDANDRAIGVRCIVGAGIGGLGLFYVNLGGT
jgi:hypothetical protein